MVTAFAALDQSDRDTARTVIGNLSRWVGLGRRLTQPWRMAVAGAPNVGKSSLVNALAGFRRSVVSPTPGTTRDVVTTRIAVDGWPVELADTAGFRDEAAALEEQGIERARAAAAGSDLCLWVLDASAEPVWPPMQSNSLRIIVNKADLPRVWDLARAGTALQVSAATGQGLTELCAALATWLVPVVPAAGDAVPFTSTFCDAVEAAARLLDAGEVVAARRVLDSIL